MNEIHFEAYVIPTERSDEESHNFEFIMRFLAALEMTTALSVYGN